MLTGNFLDILIPLLVAVLTAAGSVIGIRFRDADAYERRRGMWVWMLVAVATIATYAALDSTSGGGTVMEAIGLATAAVIAAIGAHVLWRRVVVDAERGTVTKAAIATGMAIIVVIASVSLTYVQGKACRQVQPVVDLSAQSFVIPSFGAEQGPTAGDFADRAKAIREQARQIAPGEIADHAAKLADLAGQIADAVRADDPAQHAMLGAQYYEELKPIVRKCRIRLTG
jgi:cytochrome c biogenesis factor